MNRVFLDANVLFSAAYAPGSRLLELWSLEDVELVTSSLYALEEARRNVSAEAIGRLDELASKTTTVVGARTGQLPDGVQVQTPAQYLRSRAR